MSLAKCPTVLDCNCSQFPFHNLSAEAPDPATFFSFDFETITPPLGARDSWWGTTVGREPCESVVSQQDADDCARRGAETDIWNTWRDGGVPVPLFGNRQTQCIIPCPPNFDPFIYTVPAGTVIARTQEEADAIAASICDYRGFRQKVCTPTKPKPPTIVAPQAWWKMEEAGAGIRSDIIANLSLGPPVGGVVSQATGKVNKGMEFNVPNPGSCQDTANLNYNGTVMDMTFWFNLVSQTGVKVFNLPTITWNNGQGLELVRRIGALDFYEMRRNGITIATLSAYGLGAWHFLRLLFDGAGGTIGYQIDNGALSTVVWGGINPPAGGNNLLSFYVLDSGLGNGTGDVIFDEFAVWDRKLTQSELDILYNNGNGVTWPIT